MGREDSGGALLDRLAGLETEYVARFRPDDVSARRPMTYRLLHELVEELRRRVPVVPADHPKKGFFLATGGAVWHERPGEGLDYPLIEGSTPECRGARQLLACQRAQDRLLAAAARNVSAGGDFTLCKSDCDAGGNVYGAQENYEVTLARGWRLMLWRIGVHLLLPVSAVAWAGMIVATIGLLGYFIVAGVVLGLVLMAWPVVGWVWPGADVRRVRDFLIGPAGGELFRFMPAWVSALVTGAEHVLFAPAALGLNLLGILTAFREVREGLLPFMVTRGVICGSGRLDERGRFCVAAKARGVRLVTGTGVFRMRAIFSFGPQLKGLMFFSVRPGLKFPSLLAGRQRLQIGLGDGNLCDEAEYLRVGMTMLIIDMIEAGWAGLPRVRLRRPMRALRTVAGDAALSERVELVDGRRMTAVEVQRMYWAACRAFVEAQGERAGVAEAREIVGRWGRVLDDLEEDPLRLVGRVDWVTKRWLIGTCGEGASVEARKKIDLRYHELSPDGYLERLRSAGVVREVVTDREVEEAAGGPPPGTPATRRGRLIRQWAGSGQEVKAGWGSVTVGANTIPLSDGGTG